MNENDERALIALLASRLHPEADRDLTREEVETLLEKSGEVSEEERAAFESTDPLSLIREPETGLAVIPFPMPVAESDLPEAVGFNRGGEKKDEEESAHASVNHKRQEVRKRLLRGDKTGNSEDYD